MASCIGAAWACSSSTTPTGYGSGDGTGQATNNGNSNGRSSSPSTSANGSRNYGTAPASTAYPTSNAVNNNTPAADRSTSSSTGPHGLPPAGGTSSAVAPSSGNTGCGDAGASCTAPSTGGITLNYCMQSTLGSGGYAYPFGDYQTASSCASAGSTACVNQSTLCGAGTTVPQGATYACYGNGFGVDVGTGTVTATGLSFTLSGTLPASGGQIQVADSSGTTYCAEIKKTGAQTVAWSDFNTLCYNTPPDGGTFPGDVVSKVLIQVNSSTANQTWSLCLSDISF
ncbi:MAG: hypothetical protein FWD17_17765 [Polyangiaceae bacterium]|nr:hypothetical protein [Polyangiaceae bacterium]